MDHDFGKRLEKARVERGLSIEQAAAAVRIRGTFLRALENSDLTKFPNAAYSKSFLLMYGRYLGVDLKYIAEEIDTTTQMKVEGYQYLTSRAAETPKSKPEPEPTYSMAPTPRASGSWLPLLVLCGLGVIVVVAAIFWTNVNRLGDSQPDAPKPGVARPGDETAVQPLAHLPTPTPAPKPAPAGGAGTTPPPTPALLPEPVPPRPVVVALPKPTAATDTPAVAAPAPESEIPRARPISPVARIAASDAAALADFPAPKPRVRQPAVEENNLRAEDLDAIVLEPKRKTWVVIRGGPGGQPLYEDYLYPAAKPMRLPAGRYFIELKDADAVEIFRNGKRIAYTAPGVAIQ